MMTRKKNRTRRAISLVEAMIAISILVIVVTGGSAYRYRATLDAHKADLYMTGVRTGLLLCVGWSSSGGNTSFDPVTTFSPDVNIVTSASGLTAPSGYTQLGRYKVTANRTPYYATLAWQDVSGTELRALNVAVTWDQSGGGTGLIGEADKIYRLTTYVQK